jgi:hypothetical protein
MIVVNGRIIAQAPQFDVQDVNVVTATIDLDDVRSYRASHPAFGIQAARLATDEGGGGMYGLMCDDVRLVVDECAAINKNRPKVTDEALDLKIYAPEEECCLGPACWLWDWLRRSGAAGFFLPLSGKWYIVRLVRLDGLAENTVAMMKRNKNLVDMDIRGNTEGCNSYLSNYQSCRDGCSMNKCVFCVLKSHNPP